MKKFAFLMCVLALLGLPALSNALIYNFYGQTNGGIGSVSIDVTASGAKLIVIINNTSPSLVFNQEVYAPAIDGISFNIGGLKSQDLVSWSLKAHTTKAGTQIDTISTFWSVKSSSDFDIVLMLANLSLPQGRLYNPATNGGELAGPYYTLATLEMDFKQDFKEFKDPVISLSNVGEGGIGKLQLKEVSVPEPGTLLLLGIGLIGIGIVLRELF